MTSLYLLIKPSSGNCNLKCKYCFYADVVENREISSFGLMSLSTLENIVKKALAHATRECTIGFQGGEPTLVGLDFYKGLISIVNQHNTKRLKVNYSIQTNGILIDRQWAEFFTENKFLVGLSLDGIKDVHDLYRLDSKGNGSFTEVMRVVRLFNSCKTEYNILTVVTSRLAKNIGKVYGFFKRNNLTYQQYIPCLDPLGEPPGQNPYSLTPEIYGQFLCALFDLWYNDITHDRMISIRYFDNLVYMLRGYPPESCGMAGHCTYQTVIEADGSVYPCDFYVLDEYCLGNLNTDDFASIDAKRKELRFIEFSKQLSSQCEGCRWYSICRGGCRRNREPLAVGNQSHNYFCESFKMFFEYAYERLMRLV